MNITENKYKLVEIFYSIQGEGVRVGTPNIFVRFSYCNLSCSFCDTPYNDVNLELSEEELISNIEAFNCKNIIFTGGEPTLQLNDKLLKKLKDKNFYLAIESNGIKEISSLIDFICVSPKSKKIAQLEGDELKFVLKKGDNLPNKIGNFRNYLISPEMNYNEPNFENIDYCIELIKNNPEWRLSIQSHKFLKIR
ncbi:MAG: 7-carboxy-7-deazaguanine synthase QueE [Candidatus Sericytochromatia bacterium]